MRMLLRMTTLELKLFMREPMTVLFSLALPLVVLFVMGGVFGNEAEADVYRGVGAMDYYVPAYVALVAASVGLISLPLHIAGNRERGVLKRYHGSSMPTRVVVGSQVLVTLVISLASSIVLIGVALPIHDVAWADSMPVVGIGFLGVALAFAAIGVLLGAVIPTARAAQASGVLLWFLMLMIGGAGPPPEVLSGAMGTIGDLTPLRHGIRVMQHGWLDLDAGLSWLVIAAFAVVCAGLALRFFRWE